MKNFWVYGCLIGGLSFLAVLPSEAKGKKDGIVHLSPDTYAKETSKGVVLVDYWASWCGPCRKMEPVLKSLAESRKVQVKKLNVDTYKAFAKLQNISSLPTFVLYKNGKEVKRVMGVHSLEDLTRIIEEL